MTDKFSQEVFDIAPQELRSFGRVQARYKTEYFKAYRCKHLTHKISVLQCTLKTAYKKLMIRFLNILIKTSEVMLFNKTFTDSKKTN